jgi:phospholipid/cholesterol/gamma-HCH transport system ATP-binding protein
MTAAQDDAAALFELRGVCKSFGSAEVLRGVDLRVRRGETLGVIGPSGAGKTVLLKCLVALLPIDRGQLLFEGVSVPRMSPAEQQRLRQRVGLLFQAGVVFDSMTAGENLEYALHERFYRTMSRNAMRERVVWAFRAVGLSLSELGTMPRDLSGGMKKRVGIARALVARPEVLLYDSPTEGLDPPNAHRISDLIVRLARELGVTSVVVSHDLRTIFTVCDRVGYLHEGRILETGPPASLLHSYHAEVRDFLTGHPPEEPFEPRDYPPPTPWQ